jgi:cytochrome P450
MLWIGSAPEPRTRELARIGEDIVTTAAFAGHEEVVQPLASLDVSDPAIYQQDTWRPLFARLRREAPVHYCAESRYGPYWSVTRYNDIMTVELDPAAYSSQLGGIQVEDQPADMKRGSFIRMDPPRHTAQRKTVAPVAAPINLASYEVTIRERTQAVLDALPRNEMFDWVDAVSIELTTMMLATLFDFPWDERRKLTYWSDVAVCSFRGGTLYRASPHGRRLQGAMERAGEGAPEARPHFNDGAQRGHARHARHGVRRKSGAAHRWRQRHDAQLDVGRPPGALREPG